MPEAVIHPTQQELTAFGLGKLPERAAAAVAAHLEKCPPCRQAVAGVSADSFLDKVRAAGPAGSSFPPSLAGSGNAPGSAGPPAISNVPTPDIPPELVRHPKYLILRELGRGGMGIVYQARQTMMNRQVVIKVINRALLEQPGALERFHREIRAAAQLSHPNIVTAYDAEQAGELHMLVMEFVPGQSLAEVLEKKGSQPVVNACHYMRQVALGLQHAHERGMVHRDIKPSNLILMPGPKGQVKILDFGLAKIISERNTRTGITSSGDYMGTPDYCAPEQATDARSADIRADLYSLGCTLYCLLAGHPPFQEDTAMKTIFAHHQKQPQPLLELRPDVPAELWQVVKRLLAKDPAKRYQKPIEVFQALSVFVKPGAKQSAKSSSTPAPGVGSPVKGTKITADTNQIKKVLREVPGKEPPRKVPAKETVSPSEDRVAAPAPPRIANEESTSTRRTPALWSRLWPMLAAAGVLLLVLAGILLSDVLKGRPKDGAPPSIPAPTEKALQAAPPPVKKVQKAAPPPAEKNNKPAPPNVPEVKAAEPNKKREGEPIAPPVSSKKRRSLPAAATIAELCLVLKNEDPDVLEEAVTRLVQLGPDAAPAMHDLADTLTNARIQTEVRALAALAIARIGAKAKPVVPALVRAIEHSQPREIRKHAAEALAQINYPANKDAIPAIFAAIENDDDADVRIKCVWALNGMSKKEFKESGADKKLTNVLDERGVSSALVRYNAARKLAHALRDEAPDKTVVVLLEMLTNSKKLTLKAYKGTDAKVVGGRTELQESYAADDARYLAAQGLAWLGKKVSRRKDVIEALQNAKMDSNSDLQKAATEALKDLGIP